MILYSKKDGIGYRSPFGEADEGSEVFLSTIGCLLMVIEGLPAPIILGTAVVVEKFIFCIGGSVKRFNNSISSGHMMPWFLISKNNTRIFEAQNRQLPVIL